MRISVAIPATALAIAVWLTPSLALAAPTHAPVYSSNEANSSGRGVTGTTIGRADVDGTGAVEGFVTAAEDPLGPAVDVRTISANDGTNSIGRANPQRHRRRPDPHRQREPPGKRPFGLDISPTKRSCS